MSQPRFPASGCATPEVPGGPFASCGSVPRADVPGAQPPAAARGCQEKPGAGKSRRKSCRKQAEPRGCRRSERGGSAGLGSCCIAPASITPAPNRHQPLRAAQKKGEREDFSSRSAAGESSGIITPQRSLLRSRKKPKAGLNSHIASERGDNLLLPAALLQREQRKERSIRTQSTCFGSGSSPQGSPGLNTGVGPGSCRPRPDPNPSRALLYPCIPAKDAVGSSWRLPVPELPGSSYGGEAKFGTKLGIKIKIAE